MSKRVLVVDDAPSVTSVVEFVLQDEGYDVQIVEDGHAALAAVRDARPDLILLDLGVPGIDGYGVLARLHEDPATATIPVMLVTGTQRPGDERLAPYPVVDFVLKPFSPRELVGRIGKVLGEPGDGAPGGGR